MNSNIKNQDNEQRSSNDDADVTGIADNASRQLRLASVIVQDLGEAEADIGFFARRT